MQDAPSASAEPGRESRPVKVIGRYALYTEIATGGMATVYLGRLLGPVGFSRTVAIKRLHQQYAKDPEFTTGFLDEARLAARIRHPNVVPTLDVVALDGELFLVMEYVQGESLSYLARAALRHKEPMPLAISVSIISGVLQGLHAAHEARSERGDALGIVHRDVSPQNILVGVDGVARVLDFGVAKAVGRLQSTREGQVKGKLAYMAPEQVTAGPVSRQSDLFAASIVLWELLTGRRLFRGENEAETLYNVLQGPIQPPSKFAAGVPSAVDAVVLRGLERDRANRYANAREMAVDLEKAAPMISARAIGEWVERIARDKLESRAAQVAGIEMVPTDGLRPASQPPSHGALLEAGAIPKASRAPDDSLPDAASTSGAGHTLSGPGFAARRRPLLAMAGVGAVAAIVFGILLSRSEPSTETSAEPPPASTPPVVPQLQPVTPAPIAAGTAIAEPSTQADAAFADSAAPTATAAPRERATRAPRTGTRRPPAPKQTKTAPQGGLYSRE